MTIAEYTSILRRRKWLVLAAIVLGLGLFLGYELMKPDRYQASADVLLNDQTAASLVGLAQPISSDAADRVAETQKALARVPELARRTLRVLGITDQTPSEFLENFERSDEAKPGHPRVQRHGRGSSAGHRARDRVRAAVPDLPPRA